MPKLWPTRGENFGNIKSDHSMVPGSTVADPTGN